MNRRTRSVILVILAILVPGSVRAEEPEPKGTLWAVIREDLHKQVPAAVESALTLLAPVRYCATPKS